MSSLSSDIVIIGGGPAGLTAAIYTSRMGMKTLLFEGQMLGGRMALAPQVWNFPGFPEGITGRDLVDRMVEQVKKYNVEIKSPSEVIDLTLKGETKTVATRSENYQCYAVIIATGTQRKKLQLPGETELVGRGVSYCPVCDGPLYRGMTVAVVGSSNEAFEDAFYMTTIAERVFLITHSKEIEAEKILLDEAKEKSNLTILEGQLQEIIGDEVVTAISYRTYVQEIQKQQNVNGVFIAIGGVPMTALMKKAGISVDDGGCIQVDRRQSTNIDGVFAAGDCTCGGMQIVTAAGEGAMAGMKAYRYVKQIKKELG